MSDNKISDKSQCEYTLAEMLGTLVRRKWWAVAAFSLILALGFVLSFIRVPQYSVNAAISLTNNYVFYNDLAYKYFPEESNSLWIFPGDKNYALEPRALFKIQSIIESGSFLDELSSGIDNRLSGDELAKNLRYSVSDEEMYLKMDLVCPAPDLALKIIRDIIGRITEEKSLELDAARLDLIEKLEAKTDELKLEIDRLLESGRHEKDYLASLEINNLASDYYSLKNLSEDLAQNSGLFINRIEVVDNPGESDVIQITYLKRDLIISFFVAVFLGIVAAFATDFFINLWKSLRKNR